MEPKIVENRAVFEVYVGLTASGYHLANLRRADSIRRVILGCKWSQEIVDYFRLARIDDDRVNPYWPRASILTAIGLLTDNSEKATNLQFIWAYLSKMSNISSQEADDVTAEWAVSLPKQAASLRNSARYREAYECYQEVFRTELKENGLSYEHAILAAHGRLGSLIRPPRNGVEVVTVVNPLQADPLTDIVMAGNQLNIITSHLRIESYIHELVHVCLDPYLRDWKAQICQHTHLLAPVYEQMALLRYAWDRTASSWYNVFSETLVRVLTLVAARGGTDASLASPIHELVEEGFLYAQPVFETMAENEFKAPLAERWLDECLGACLTVAQPHIE